jgi:hypothetical protein
VVSPSANFGQMWGTRHPAGSKLKCGRPPPPPPPGSGVTLRTHLIPLGRRFLGRCYAFDSAIVCGHVFCFVIPAW